MTDLHIGSRSFITRIGELAEVTPVEGVLDPGPGVRYTRTVTFPVWSGGGAGFGVGSMRIYNPAGRYDYLLDLDLRDREVALFRVGPDGQISTADRIMTALIDGVQVSDEFIDVSLKTTLARADIPFQLSRYPTDETKDDVEEYLQGRVRPVLIGVARQIPAILVNSQNLLYHVHDDAVSGIAAVYDSALILDPTASPDPEWTFSTDRRGFNLADDNEPAGVVTCDASSFGDSLEPAPSDTDLLDGAGQFEGAFSQVGATTVERAPEDFATFSAPTSLPTPNRWDANRELRTDFGYPDGSPQTYFMRCNLPPASGAFVQFTYSGSAGAFMERGKTYRIRVEILRTQAGSVPGYFAIRSQPEGFEIMRIVAGVDPAGFYTVHFTVPTEWDADQRIALRFVGASCRFQIDALTVTEVDVVQGFTLPAITFPDYVREIMQRRAQLPESSWDQASAEEIGAETSPARGFGLWVNSETTCLAALRMGLRSFFADAVPLRDGVIRFVRLRDPALEDDGEIVLDITRWREDRRPRVWIDDAPGLTTSATARPNYHVFNDGEFADNLEDLPLERRAQLKEEAQFTIDLSDEFESLPSQYRHAFGNDPFRSLFDQATDAREVLTEVLSIYTTLRYFVEIVIDTDLDLEPWQLVRFTWSRYGFHAGRKMFIRTIEETITGASGARAVRLVLWG